MRTPLVFGTPFLATLLLAASASAAGGTYYVSPTGTATSGCTSRDNPCDLNSAATGAIAGDTVILMDGVYKQAISVANSGTATDWITFKADDCALPILEGPGVDPMSTQQDTGAGSAVATYLKFVGIAARGWSAAFSNGWTGTDTTTANGHFEFDYCIGDGNGRTGFTFFSAQGIKVKNCISAHNGSSIAESWSSGITLYEAQGSAGDSWIEGNVSFENMDAQQHTDGSGYIIDEFSNGATFINNVGFRNGGSCLRLTKSSNTKFINNTCYHDGQDTADQGPSNPGEVYFTSNDSSTVTGVNFMNNVFVATGTGPGAMAIFNQPTSGWTNNTVVNSGAVTFFTGAEGANPDFTLASGSSLAAKGGTNADVPTNDLGFDPKCIVKKVPTMVGMIALGSWWQYSVDLAYIKSIGGVQKCFNPKARSGTPDIGAYSNGAVTTSPVSNCMAPTTGSGGAPAGTGPLSVVGAAGTGTVGTAGAPAAGGSAGAMTGAGGTAPAGGMTSAGGTAPAGGMTSAGGSVSATGGAPTGTGGSGTGGSGATGGTATGTTGGSATAAGGTSAGTAPAAGASTTTTGSGGSGSDTKSTSGCGCRVSGDSSDSKSLAAIGLFGLAAFGVRRRRSR